MHDPCTIAFLYDPSIFSFEKYDITVETKGSETYGRTVPSRKKSNGKVHMGVKADVNKFWDLFFKAIVNLP
ncbi:MAG: nucleoside hydrolase [Sphaerochaetaceae bacterium]|nr:nucleoside hydrolase [Sphaerochaetaceae bacterium]